MPDWISLKKKKKKKNQDNSRVDNQKGLLKYSYKDF